MQPCGSVRRRMSWSWRTLNGKGRSQGFPKLDLGRQGIEIFFFFSSHVCGGRVKQRGFCQAFIDVLRWSGAGKNSDWLQFLSDDNYILPPHLLQFHKMHYTIMTNCKNYTFPAVPDGRSGYKLQQNLMNLKKIKKHGCVLSRHFFSCSPVGP